MATAEEEQDQAVAAVIAAQIRLAMIYGKARSQRDESATYYRGTAYHGPLPCLREAVQDLLQRGGLLPAEEGEPHAES